MSSEPRSASQDMTLDAASPSSADKSKPPFFKRLTSSRKSNPAASYTSPPELAERSGPTSSKAPVAQEVAGDPSSSSSKLPKAKLNALERLKKFGSRAGKAKAKSPSEEFPPPEWGVGGRAGLSGSQKAGVTEGDGAEGIVLEDGKHLSPTPAPGASSIDVSAEENATTSGVTAGDTEVPPEPISIAKRIQLLLSMLTSSQSTTPGRSTAPSGASTPFPTPLPTPTTAPEPPSSSTQPPEPPDNAIPSPTTGGLVSDSRLVALLSSANVMNGSVSKGTQSVWALLDKLRFSSLRGSSSSAPETTDKGKAKEEEEMQGAEDVMLYAPLEPHSDSEVEVAESEIVTLNGDADDEVAAGAEGEPKIEEGGKPEAGEEGKANSKEKHEKKVKEKVVWVPSTTKISLQAAWWGYRIYLPPPVLHVLNNKSFEAAKRAALITTALKWLLDHLPTRLLPPQFRPAAMLLKRLVPLLGYIGTFIAWSWSAIKAFDKGHGVILSATWLLPVALVPGTWDENEFPTQREVVSVTPAHALSGPRTA